MFRKLLRSCFVVLIISTTSCSKSPSDKAHQEELTSLLPNDTVFYAVADCQNSDFRKWIQSPNYKKYLQLSQSALKKNDPVMGNFSTYIETMQALGFVPLNDTDPAMPYGKALYFATIGMDKSVGLAGYYNAVPEKSAKEVFAKVKTLLSSKGIVTTDIAGTGFTGFSFEPFANGSSVEGAVKFYRESLKISTVFFGASDTRLVIATSRPLLDRGFLPGKNEASALVDGDVTKRTLTAAGVSSNAPTFAVFDIAKIAAQTGASANDLALLPTSIVGLNTVMSSAGLSMDFAALVEPRDERQKEIVASLPTPGKAGLFAKLPLKSALGLSLDGPFLKMIIGNAQKYGGMPAAGPFGELLAKIEGINLGVAPSNGLTMIPDLALTIITSDAKALLEQVKSLSALAPPGAVTWQDAVIEGVPGYSIPTPLTRVQLVAVDDVVVASTSGDVLTSIIKKTSGNDLHATEIVSNNSKNVKGPYFGVFLDYNLFATLMENSLKSAAAFVPAGQMIPTEQLEAMKQLGKIVFSFGYEPGVARMSMSQEFPKAE